MSGATPFNGDLFCCEHLIVEDEEASIESGPGGTLEQRLKRSPQTSSTVVTPSIVRQFTASVLATFDQRER